jgi:hypothetical protein
MLTDAMCARSLTIPEIASGSGYDEISNWIKVDGIADLSTHRKKKRCV